MRISDWSSDVCSSDRLNSVFAGTAEKSIASISKSAKLFFAGLTAALLMRLPSQLDRQCRRRLRAGPARCGAYPWQVATREFREGPPRAYARGAGWYAGQHWRVAPARSAP